jgi:hypothetical protein
LIYAVVGGRRGRHAPSSSTRGVSGQLEPPYTGGEKRDPSMLNATQRGSKCAPVVGMAVVVAFIWSIGRSDVAVPWPARIWRRGGDIAACWQRRLMKNARLRDD